MTAESRGILNVLNEIGILLFNINPLAIWHCGTVGDKNGYLTPLAKFGAYKFENPIKGLIFGRKYAVFTFG